MSGSMIPSRKVLTVANLFQAEIILINLETSSQINIHLQSNATE